MPASGRVPLDTNIVIGLLEGFAAGRSILPCDLNVARAYGQVRQRLREKGRPIPENDIWIAATANVSRTGSCHPRPALS